jgi:hypothetical protein
VSAHAVLLRDVSCSRDKVDIDAYADLSEAMALLANNPPASNDSEAHRNHTIAGGGGACMAGYVFRL